MEKRKIVILTSWYLPGTKAGGPVRSIYSLTALLKDFYDFYIITTNTDLGSHEPYKDIKAGEFFEREGINFYYFSERDLSESAMISLIKNLNPDLVYVNSFWSYNFSINIVRAYKNGLLNVPVLLAPRGMLSKGALGLKRLKKSIFLRIAKFLKWYNGIIFHATNEEERQDILKQFPDAKVLLAPNVNSGTVYSISKPKEKKHLKLFYLSRIAEVKNLHFALEVLSSIPSTYSIEYDIYGNLEDRDYWEKCRVIISKLPSHITVTYRHELQFNEVQSVIVSYHALFLPTLNENFGHSIVESLLCGCPVIISDQTPWNDLKENNAGEAITLDNKSAFVKAICELAELSSIEYAVKSADAIRYISGKLNIKESIEQYKKVFDESVKK
ncbi:MAG: glycosyltransferase [Bacteroidia bacterium]